MNRRPSIQHILRSLSLSTIQTNHYNNLSIHLKTDNPKTRPHNILYRTMCGIARPSTGHRIAVMFPSASSKSMSPYSLFFREMDAGTKAVFRIEDASTFDVFRGCRGIDLRIEYVLSPPLFHLFYFAFLGAIGLVYYLVYYWYTTGILLVYLYQIMGRESDVKLCYLFVRWNRPLILTLI